MDNDIIRPLVTLGAGFCLGASYFFLTYYRNSISQPEKSGPSVQELKERLSQCCQETPVECSDTSGQCCQDGTEQAPTQSGCGGGSCGGGTTSSCSTATSNVVKKAKKVESITFLVGSRGNCAANFAAEVLEYIAAFNPGLPVEKMDIESCSIQQIEEIFTEKSKHRLYVLVIASYPDESFCENLRAYLDESTTDWRVGKGHLKQTAGLIPIILGDSTYGADVFCQPGNDIARNFTKLGGARSAHFEIDNLNEKPDKYFKDVCRLIDETISYGQVEEPVNDGDDESDEEGEEEAEEIDIEMSGSCKSGKAIDLEDIADQFASKERAGVKLHRTRVAKEMISDKLRGALSKQGYHLVGSHSGVKICRWTKNQLRGRGGCYKHSFYGIESHRCMEATPSLACANKCVFCWRHHTNPVGTEWRWVTDEPKALVDGMLEGHKGMVKQLRGVPGVTSEKMVEAMNPVHCALSLVGEPIMYPRINEFLDYLHGHGISSYLVTNAQFPDEILTLPPVTQLYASIDGSTKAEMKAIDRPLHRDFWERFQTSLKNMKHVCARTVYRLTLVAGFNLSDVEGYADLVAIAEPDFIEVKGVTYCGTSNNAELSMKNVPWHDQVLEFCESLSELLPEYSIACEHEHSNCVLIAHHRFKTETGWKTWIDYPRFQQLYDEWKETGTKFRSVDYSTETPSWAVFGASERGFDPDMKRHFRNKKTRSVPPGSNGPM